MGNMSEMLELVIFYSRELPRSIHQTKCSSQLNRFKSPALVLPHLSCIFYLKGCFMFQNLLCLQESCHNFMALTLKSRAFLSWRRRLIGGKMQGLWALPQIQASRCASFL